VFTQPAQFAGNPYGLLRARREERADQQSGNDQGSEGEDRPRWRTIVDEATPAGSNGESRVIIGLCGYQIASRLA